MTLDNGTSAPSEAATTNGEVPAPEKAKESLEKDVQVEKVEKLRQKVEITKDGKKRVAPLLVSTSAGFTESSLPQTQLVSTSRNTISKHDAPQSVLDLSKPYDGLPRGGLASLLLGNKRKLAETENDEVVADRLESITRTGATPVMMNGTDGLALPNQALAQDVVARPSLLNPSLLVSQIRLSTPNVRPVIIRPLDGATKALDAPEPDKPNSSDSHILEVRNSTNSRPSEREPTRITVTKRDITLWQDFCPKAVSLVTGNSRFWAAASEDGSVYVWSPAGRRLFNPFAIEAQPVILDARGPWLLCISAVGQCYVWNIETSAAAHPPVSLAPVLDIAAHSQGPHLTGGPSVIFARLSSAGRVFVALSNGDAYAYNPVMYVWQRVSEAWWAVGSQYWNSSESAQSFSKAGGDLEEDDVVRVENISAGIIPLLERNTTSQTLLRGRPYFLGRLIKSLLNTEGYENLESVVSLAHLENRLAAALTLGARDEF